MRIGVFLGAWGALATTEHVRNFAAVAEAGGFTTLWVGDHLVIPRTQGSAYPYSPTGRSPFRADDFLLEPISLVGYLAGRVSRIGLGISVYVLPLRNPVLSAKQLACLQALSGGRLSVGIGLGWLGDEFRALQADFKARGRRTEDYLRVLRHLWTTPQAPIRTDAYAVPAVGFAPAPSPLPPLLVGGNSAAAIGRAARHADGWHPLRISAERVARGRERLGRAAAAAGRDPALLKVVLRRPLLDADELGAGPPRPGGGLRATLERRLRPYHLAGVDEFVVEFPLDTVAPGRQLAWLEWLGALSRAGFE